MRFANLNDRPVIVTEHGFIDVCKESRGLFPSDMNDALKLIDDIEQWFEEFSPHETEMQSIELSQFDARLKPVSPNPSQIFVIGLNYRHHAEEMGLPIPKNPMEIGRAHV